jgi:cysteine-S-conjugate beta-lyase
MPYDFNQIIPRRETDSIKWNQYEADVLPMWVADMDFQAPPPVLQALHARIDHGILGYASFNCDLYDAIIERMERLIWRGEYSEMTSCSSPA